MKASVFETTMNDQILRQQNQEIQKQNQKKQHERRVEDATQLEVVQEEAKVHGKLKKQSTLLAKRRRVAEALNKKQVKTTKASKNQKTSMTKLGKLTKPSTKETVQEETKETYLGSKLTPAAEGMIKHFSLQMLGRNIRFSDELEDLEFLETPEEINEPGETQEAATSQTGKAKTTTKTKDSKLVKDHLAKLSPKDKKEYISKLVNGNSKEILDTLINPKYMIGCTMTPEELLLFRRKVQKKARFLRGIIGKSVPEALRVVRKLGYGSGLGGLGDEDSGLGQGAPKPSSDESPNSAIFESMAAALDLTSLLQKLGIQSNILETNIEANVAGEEVKESQAIATKNVNAMQANAHRSKCAKIIQILSYVAAAILIVAGQPEAGLLIIATTSGLMAEVLKKLAQFLGVSEFGLKCMIMVMTIIISIITANPEIMGDEANSLLTSFGNVMLISATIGFTTDLLGVIATGHTDADNYPAWVNYAAMGINFASMLPEIGLGIYRGVSRGLARMASSAADKAAVEASAAQAAADVAKAEASTVQEVSESVSTGAGSAETGGEGAQGTSAQGGSSQGGARGGTGAAEGVTSEAAASSNAPVRGEVSSAAAPKSDALERAVSAADGKAGSVEELETLNSSPGRPVTGQAAKVGDGAPLRSTEEGTAKADKVEDVEKASDGEDSVDAPGIDTLGSTSVSGSAAQAIDQAAAGDTELMEEAKDPFKVKVEKIGEAIQKAKADLARLEDLEGAMTEGTAEEAAEFAGQLQAAQKAVEDAEAELKEVVESAEAKVAKTEEAAAAAKEKLETAKTNLKNAQDRLAKVEVKTPSAKQGRIAKMKAYLNAKFGDISKILLLADTGAQTYAQFKMAEIDTELGQIMAEVAELTGNYDLLNSFFEVIGAAQQSTNTRNEQYSKDLHDEIKLVGDIINAERSASNILMSA